MQKLKHKEHDFSAKLRQSSVIERLKKYIAWQRNVGSAPSAQILSAFSPLSINLDLTSACNFACPHCVDSTIINKGKHLKIEDIKHSINVLSSRGLLSVILLGGGEPTLHKNFEEIVSHIKKKRLQLGIVTNGSRLDRVAKVAGLLKQGDWVRISIDAAREETFAESHQTKNGLSLDEILRKARSVKVQNPLISLGYSFVIVWDGIYLDGYQLCRNIAEMSEAVSLARENSFDYVSFKPCLVRQEDSQRESLFEKLKTERQRRIIADINHNLEKAKQVAQGQIKILESVNLRAMLKSEVHKLKKQPKVCHMQFFRTVVTPTGIFHCPAFRGIEKAKIAASNGYAGESIFDATAEKLASSLLTFDAARECNVVACFYNHANWWLEEFICSGKNVDEIEEIEDDNFFL